MVQIALEVPRDNALKALALMEEALALLDQIEVAMIPAASLDLAVERLRELLQSDWH